MLTCRARKTRNRTDVQIRSCLTANNDVVVRSLWIFLKRFSCQWLAISIHFWSCGGTHRTLDREQSIVWRRSQPPHLSERAVLELLEQVELWFLHDSFAFMPFSHCWQHASSNSVPSLSGEIYSDREPRFSQVYFCKHILRDVSVLMISKKSISDSLSLICCQWWIGNVFF